MKYVLGRLSKLEEKSLRKTLQPVFVESLDELDTSELYSTIFCRSEDIHRAHEFTFETLFYGGI